MWRLNFIRNYGYPKSNIQGFHVWHINDPNRDAFCLERSRVKWGQQWWNTLNDSESVFFKKLERYDVIGGNPQLVENTWHSYDGRKQWKAVIRRQIVETVWKPIIKEEGQSLFNKTLQRNFMPPFCMNVDRNSFLTSLFHTDGKASYQGALQLSVLTTWQLE